MFVFGADEDAAFAVFRLASSVYPYPCSSGDLVDGGEKPLEFRAHRDGDRIDQGEDEVVGVLEGVADEVQALGGLAGTEVEIVRGAEKLAVHGVADLVIADEFVKHDMRKC